MGFFYHNYTIMLTFFFISRNVPTQICLGVVSSFSIYWIPSLRTTSGVWPLQIMLLVISPKVLEEIVNADSGAPCSPRHSRKKIFLGMIEIDLSLIEVIDVLMPSDPFRFTEESFSPTRY